MTTKEAPFEDQVYTTKDLEEAREDGYTEGFYDGENAARELHHPPPDILELARRGGFNILDGVWMRYDASTKEIVVESSGMELRVAYEGGGG